MKATAEVKTQSSTLKFEFDDQKEIDAIHKAIIIGNPPYKCDVCGNKDFFKFDSNKNSEGHVFVNYVCRKCGAKAKLGQYKSGGYFWHKFEKYVKPSDSNTQQSTPPEPVPDQGGDDKDLPF